MKSNKEHKLAGRTPVESSTSPSPCSPGFLLSSSRSSDCLLLAKPSDSHADLHSPPVASPRRRSFHHRCNSHDFAADSPEPNNQGTIDEEEEECSDSEETIRKILREREERRRRKDEIGGMQRSMSKLVTLQRAEMRQKEEEKKRLREKVICLLKGSAPSSRVNTPDTVVTAKSSFATMATLVDSPEAQSSADTAQSLRPAKPPKSTTPIPSTQKPNNHRLIKTAISAICLPGEHNRKTREVLFHAMDSHYTNCNFVVAFKGAIGRQELGAVYEQDQKLRLLRKVVGPPTYPLTITPQLVQCCYHYDSSARRFQPMQHKRFALTTDAVTLVHL